MPYASEGNLITDKREIAVSETWETQTEWEAFQESNDIDISNGTIQLLFSDIPTSVVSRTDDNGSNDNPGKLGVQLTSELEWPEFGGRLSANADNETRAYIHRVSDGQLMGDVDISSLTSGDAFTIDLDSNLQPDDGTDATTYNFVTDAEGADRTYGFNNTVSFPVTSGDGDLSMISGASGETGTVGSPHNLVEIGNVGF